MEKDVKLRQAIEKMQSQLNQQEISTVSLKSSAQSIAEEETLLRKSLDHFKVKIGA